jgi:transposase-like protein
MAGVDQTYFKIKGKKICLNIAASPQGDILSSELLSEESSQPYASIFNQLKQGKRFTPGMKKPIVPLTNNHTERAIIGSKLRHRTTRGLKSEEGCLNFFGLNCYIHNEMSKALLSLA